MTETGERAFRAAIVAIETVSSAEIVITVRPRLVRWLVPNIAASALATFGVLVYVLYSDTEFDLWSIVVLPMIAALAGGMIVEAIPPLERWLVPLRHRRRVVEEAARAAFYELGVHRTTMRTGILVMVAVRERSIAFVGDVAVIERVGQRALDRHSATLAQHIPAGAEALARALEGLAGGFGAPLPRAADDVNELPDLVHARPPSHRRLRGGPS